MVGCPFSRCTWRTFGDATFTFLSYNSQSHIVLTLVTSHNAFSPTLVHACGGCPSPLRGEEQTKHRRDWNSVFAARTHRCTDTKKFQGGVHARRNACLGRIINAASQSRPGLIQCGARHTCLQLSVHVCHRLPLRPLPGDIWVNMFVLATFKVARKNVWLKGPIDRLESPGTSCYRSRVLVFKLRGGFVCLLTFGSMLVSGVMFLRMLTEQQQSKLMFRRVFITPR